MSVIHEPVNSPISQTGKDMQNQNTVGEFNTTPPRLYEDNFISPPTSPEIRHSMNFHQSHRSSCINKVDPVATFELIFYNKSYVCMCFQNFYEKVGIWNLGRHLKI
jgi:hypothetical protein